jgi:hypothetical protein
MRKTIQAKKKLSATAKRPSLDEWLETTLRAKPIRGKQTPAQIIRKLRDSR